MAFTINTKKHRGNLVERLQKSHVSARHCTWAYDGKSPFISESEPYLRTLLACPPFASFK